MHEMCNLLSVDYFENVQWMVHACKCPDEVGSASTEFAGICGQINADLKVLRYTSPQPLTVSYYILEWKVSNRLHKTLDFTLFPLRLDAAYYIVKWCVLLGFL